MGHDVKVLTYGIDDFEGFQQSGDFLFKEYKFQRIPVVSVKHKTNHPDFDLNIFDHDIETTLERILGNEQFDIIHICHPMRLGYIKNIKKFSNIPTVLTLTDFWLLCPKAIAVTIKGELCVSPENGKKCIRECYNRNLKNVIMQRFNEAKSIINSVDVLVSPTYFLANIFKNLYNRDIRVIKHGI
ncbi:MAG: glycosyltransferase [Promethearchaeota archaeon]